MASAPDCKSGPNWVNIDGSSPSLPTSASVAQTIERLTRNEMAGGLTPPTGSNDLKLN